MATVSHSVGSCERRCGYCVVVHGSGYNWRAHVFLVINDWSILIGCLLLVLGQLPGWLKGMSVCPVCGSMMVGKKETAPSSKGNHIHQAAATCSWGLCLRMDLIKWFSPLISCKGFPPLSRSQPGGASWEVPWEDGINIGAETNSHVLTTSFSGKLSLPMDVYENRQWLKMGKIFSWCKNCFVSWSYLSVSVPSILTYRMAGKFRGRNFHKFCGSEPIRENFLPEIFMLESSRLSFKQFPLKSSYTWASLREHLVQVKKLQIKCVFFLRPLSLNFN